MRKLFSFTKWYQDQTEWEQRPVKIQNTVQEMVGSKKYILARSPSPTLNISQ